VVREVPTPVVSPELDREKKTWRVAPESSRSEMVASIPGEKSTHVVGADPISCRRILTFAPHPKPLWTYQTVPS